MERIKGNPLIGWMKNRIKKNKNVIIVINGETGSGKTYVGLSLVCDIAKELNTNFHVNTNIDFNFVELLKKTMLPENTKAGTAFLFEEVGAMGGGSSSREWQSKANKFFFSFMQTARHKQQILILTCPMFSFLELGARSLVHMQIIMQGIDYKEKRSFVKPYIIQVNPRTGKFYFKLLRFTIDGQRHKLTSQAIKCPSEDVIREYEAMKTEYTKKLSLDIIKDGDGKEKTTERRYKGNGMELVNQLVEAGRSNQEISNLTGYALRTVQAYKKRKIEGGSNQENGNIGLIQPPVGV